MLLDVMMKMFQSSVLNWYACQYTWLLGIT